MQPFSVVFHWRTPGHDRYAVVPIQANTLHGAIHKAALVFFESKAAAEIPRGETLEMRAAEGASARITVEDTATPAATSAAATRSASAPPSRPRPR